MQALSGAWLALALVQLIAWIGASLLGAGLGPLPRVRRSRLIGAIALLGLASALAASGVAVALVASDWTWGAEKLLVAAPIGVVSSVAATVLATATRCAPRARPRHRPRSSAS